MDWFQVRVCTGVGTGTRAIGCPGTPGTAPGYMYPDTQVPVPTQGIRSVPGYPGTPGYSRMARNEKNHGPGAQGLDTKWERGTKPQIDQTGRSHFGMPVRPLPGHEYPW
eukprot:3230809-Rhodomonas_salina.1